MEHDFLFVAPGRSIGKWTLLISVFRVCFLRWSVFSVNKIRSLYLCKRSNVVPERNLPIIQGSFPWPWGRGGALFSNSLHSNRFSAVVSEQITRNKSQRQRGKEKKERRTLLFFALVPFFARPEPKIPFLGLSLLWTQMETLAKDPVRMLEDRF